MKYKIEPYIEKEKIEERIKKLGEIITNDYKDKTLKCICILKGGAPFLCSLIKYIKNENLTIDFMSVSSYGNETDSSGVVRILKDLDSSIENENIIIVEDIIDSGNTLYYLKNLLSGRNPKSIKICTLLDKPARREVDIKADYVGFEIEDKYIAGFGLDYEQKYRQLPYIGEVVFLDK